LKPMAAAGIADPAMEQVTEQRIREAHAAMARIDEIMAETTGAERERRLADFRHEVDRLNESTVCEKSELNWPAQVRWTHVFSNIALWFRINFETLFPKTRTFEPQPVEWKN